ncbi:MAG: prolipoprotein diacylglyceryl transferase [Bacteroidetes bacterium]|nr:prolipoprotein diacylglyceryl transferase [Bacteroidota bacterium]
MHPILFRLETPGFLKGILPDHITLYSYGFLIAIGILVSFFFARPRVKKLGIDGDKFSTILIWAILAGFVGGRLFFYFEDWGRYMENPSQMLRITGGGFVFYGSVIFVIPTFFLLLRKYKISVRPFLDVMAFVGPIVQSFGRVGCFLAGCCHGRVCHNSLGVTFTDEKSMATPLNVPLYPTQLFDILINVIILITLFLIEKKQKFSGQLMLIYLMMYAVGRSINEEFRGDEARGFLFDGWLSHSQFIAIILFALSVLVWMKWRNLPEDKLWK